MLYLLNFSYFISFADLEKCEDWYDSHSQIDWHTDRNSQTDKFQLTIRKLFGLQFTDSQILGSHFRSILPSVAVQRDKKTVA